MKFIRNEVQLTLLSKYLPSVRIKQRGSLEVLDCLEVQAANTRLEVPFEVRIKNTLRRSVFEP